MVCPSWVIVVSELNIFGGEELFSHKKNPFQGIGKYMWLLAEFVKHLHSKNKKKQTKMFKLFISAFSKWTLFIFRSKLSSDSQHN